MVMSGKMVSLKDKSNNNVFPQTSSQAVYMNDGKTLEALTDEGVFFGENDDIIQLNKPEIIEKVNNIESELGNVSSQLEYIENHTKGYINILDFQNLVIGNDWSRALTEAINSINGVGEIKFPNGIYSFSTPIELIGGTHYTTGGIKITGENKAGTILKLINTHESFIKIINSGYNTELNNITIDGNNMCTNTISVTTNLAKSSWENLIVKGGINGIIFSENLWQNNFNNIMIYGTEKGFIMQRSGTSNIINNSFVYGTTVCGWDLRGDYSTGNGLACDNASGTCYNFSYGSWNITSLGIESDIFTTGICVSQATVNIDILTLMTKNKNNDITCIKTQSNTTLVIGIFNLISYSEEIINSNGKIFDLGRTDCTLSVERFNKSSKLQYNGEFTRYSDTGRTYFILEGVFYNVNLYESDFKMREIIGNFSNKTGIALNGLKRREITWCTTSPNKNSFGSYDWESSMGEGTLFISENSNESNVAGFLRTDIGEKTFNRDCTYTKIPISKSCTTENRPTQNLFIDLQVFDTTLGKPIWWDGSKWVDAMGNAV